MEVSLDIVPTDAQVAKARTVCRACNESLDIDKEFGDHEDNDSCIEDSCIDQFDTAFWCDGCRAEFTVQRTIVDWASQGV